jgi:hypothetical protein
MSDVLAIFGTADGDAELLSEIATCHPRRVTVLLEDGHADLLNQESAEGRAARDRLAGAMSEIERTTGATVVGLAGDRAQLVGWRFDRELVSPRVALAA